MRESLPKPDYFVPLDLIDLGSEQEVRRLVKQLVRQFGELLEVWPDVVKETKELRDKGITLTKVVRPRQAGAAG